MQIINIQSLLEIFSLKRDSSEIIDQQPESELFASSIEQNYQNQVKTQKISNNAIMIQQNKSNGSVINADVIIKGSVESKSDLMISGSVTGDIVCDGNVTVSKSNLIQGNIFGNNINIYDAEITGHINAKQGVIIGDNSVISGNVDALTISVAGTVNGNITTTGMAIFKSNANINGDITAGAINVEEKASINGYMKISPDRAELYGKTTANQ